ncbi:MAG: tetratricopeptide repeat protein [Cyanobacteria bacterium J06642_2]
MREVSPVLYLVLLAGFLGWVAWQVFREVSRTRRQENVIRELQPKLRKEQGSPEEYYELGSVYLEKRLYEQAILQFKKAIAVAGEDIPPVCNALGFAYFAQEQYDLAIRYYKSAVSAEPKYATAWNNLGHAYEKKNLTGPALEAYEAAIVSDPSNQLACRRAESLRKRITPSPSSSAS